MNAKAVQYGGHNGLGRSRCELSPLIVLVCYTMRSLPTFHKENSVLPLSVPPYKEREAITGWRVTDRLYPISLECIS